MKANDPEFSKAFEKQVLRAVSTIVVFVFVYLILLAAAIFLASFGVVVGFMIGVAAPSLLTIGLAIGLAGAGVFILVFLLQFLFKRHKIDRSALREIKRYEEPELFQMIDEIVAQVGTKHPKRIYLSDQVNASVFYDSGFWSMFLPVEKNLEIGLGLVNSVTKSELKAVLAHEFGHFSQRSMKVGSYVYQVNQVIFNMLYDNTSFDEAANSWAQTSALFALPVMGAYRLIQGIQWVLAQMYGLINRSYMALSREMEFHADEIAARVTGSVPLQTSLLRLGFSNESHQATLQFFADNSGQFLQTKNIFHSHAACMLQLAKRNDLSFEHDLPKIEFDDLNKFNRSKLVVKDQWASHPSVQERIERLEALQLPASTLDHSPANSMFRKIDEYQEYFSDKFFAFFETNDSPTQLSAAEFEEKLLEQWSSNDMPPIYNGYYEFRQVEPFDLVAAQPQNQTVVLEALFSQEKLDLVLNAYAMQQDIQTLKFIEQNPKSAETFDYDGERYGAKASKYLVQRLEKDYHEINYKLLENERNAFVYFNQLEANISGTSLLKKMYLRCFDFQRSLDSRFEIFDKINEAIQFIAIQTPQEQILIELRNLKKIEVQFKDILNDILNADFLPEFVSSGILEAQIIQDIELYCSKDWEYFGSSRYLDENLQVLYKALNLYHYLLFRIPFLLKKQLLDYQFSLIK